jgi:hypothetical protein
MKAILYLPVLSLGFCMCPLDESQATTGPAPTPPPQVISSSASEGSWHSSIRDWSSTLWEMSEMVTNASTAQAELRLHHYVEVADGLNFIDSAGVWQRSVDQIDVLPRGEGAAAVNGPLKVYFPPRLNTQTDGITIVTASNTILKLRPVGLYYFDASSGKSVLLASLRDGAGELVAPNQLVYRSVFQGLLCDIRYTYTKGAFESDLVLLQRPRSPESYGLNPSATRLELWHVAIAPTPKLTSTLLDTQGDSSLRAQMAEPDFIDETVDFGDAWFPQGRAFSWGISNLGPTFGSGDQPMPIRLPRPGSTQRQTIVGKRWGQIGDKTGLCESVRWLDIKAELDALPPDQGATPLPPATKPSSARELPLPLERPPVEIGTNAIKVAYSHYRPKGVVLDYTVLSSGSSFSFRSGETYFISSLASFRSTVELAPNCVIKYNDEAALYLTGPVVCGGSRTEPSVLTSFHDFAFGERLLPGATGYPTYSASDALWLGSTGQACDLRGLKIRWAQTALLAESSPGHVLDHRLTDSSLEWCQTGVFAKDCSLAFQDLNICSLNGLMDGAGLWGYTGVPNDVCLGDADQNGLLDSWEYKYFGRIGVDPLGDPDGDGANNLLEYHLGLNPQVSDGAKAELEALSGKLTGPAALMSGSLPFSSTPLLVRPSVGPNNNLITPLTVTCTDMPSNIVAWWRAEGDATDAIGGMDGKYCGTTRNFTAAEVGQGFNLGGVATANYIKVPSNPILKQLTNAFTVEMWFKDTGSQVYGVALIGKLVPGFFGFSVDLIAGQNLAMHFGDPAGNFANLVLTNPPAAGALHHLAASWEQTGSSIKMQLYIDGSLRTNGTFTGSLARVVNDAPLMIGSDLPTGAFFTGVIDEASLYSRVLTSTEITNIYSAGSLGKCVPSVAPSISLSPADQTVSAGSDILLSALGAGSGPLAYQWRLNGANIPSATNQTFITNNVVIGTNSYSFVVTNSLGSVTSSVASLAVTSAPPSISAPSNLVAWWKAETNALDQMGGNNGALLNSASYAAGKSGQGFVFPGTLYYGTMNVPSSPTLNFTNELTYELWYKSPVATNTIATYGLLNKYPIPQLCCCSTVPANYGGLVVGDDYYMNLYLSDTNYGMQSMIYWPPPVAGMFHHMALSYRQATSNTVQLILYLDGASVRTNSVSGVLANAQNNSPVSVGAWRADGQASFNGTIDEAAVYSRALSASEIASIYNAGSGGKILPTNAPTIVVQPTDQTAALGSEVLLSVFATGTPPLAYQWQFNGSPIAGATNKNYILNNVQALSAGSYAVLVTNVAGNATSQTAVVSVASAPSCVGPPAGLVSWWRAEGDGTDCVGTNNGSLVNGVSYGSGKVNQGFSFGGTNYVSIASSATLRLTGAFTVELWYKDTGSTTTYGLISKAASSAPYACNFVVWAQPNGAMSAGFRDTTINALQYVSCTPVPLVGMFHHVAAVYQQTDGSHVSINLYFDGQCAAAKTFSGNLANTLDNTPVTLGSFYGNYLTGIIDEASVYSRALSLSEIQAIYAAQASGKCLSGDYDNDGLLDAWERQYFGNLSQLANGDPDGDGLSNLQEYLLGTSPVSNDLGLKVLITKPKEGSFLP